MNHCQLLGKDYPEYGEVSLCKALPNIACAISVGADKNSSSLVFKGNKASPNEDAVFAANSNGRIVMAVADSHFGQWASHAIIVGIAQHVAQITDLDSTYKIFQRMCEEAGDEGDASETTLVVVSVNIATGEGFGISFGDSTALVLNTQTVTRLTRKTLGYVSLSKAMSMEDACAKEFTFQIKAGEMLVLFTDGINECHYGQPETSVNNQDILTLFQKTPDDVTHYVTQLTHLALKGVRGNPGGQDNIAIAAMML